MGGGMESISIIVVDVGKVNFDHVFPNLQQIRKNFEMAFFPKRLNLLLGVGD